ncbi:hypothetical protein Poli38472_003796 [Pythium oligandrum]|uniref:TRP C-terminal domain-containing protein n=1 Tax=Pythium oligandrum TaxID=41045 RepID=A0A8K1FKG4_PYTOL|nr:hypothetical protein Poli38472_003796 [Pythium oligandrum]|eukprot:TMW66031.1 hypothetical protein Poli38472_003796 [Pythium oligandrum]
MPSLFSTDTPQPDSPPTGFRPKPTSPPSFTPVPTRTWPANPSPTTGTIDTNGSAVSDGALKAVILNPSRIPAVVIGGSDATAGTRTLQQVSGRDVYRFLQVLTSVLALLSCLALIVFHFAAADERLMSTWAPESPNAWEFVLYIGYIQRMASLSHLVVRRVPYFLWNYADNFSWTVFVPFHGSSVQPASRRLYEVVVLDGVVGFANRIGVSEGGLLVRSMIGLLVVLGIVAAVIGITTAVTKPRDVYDPDDELEFTRSSSVVSTPKIREATSSWRIKTELAVLVWLAALYPMAMLSSFEIGMEICAHDVTAFSLVVAIVALLFGCAGIFVYRVVMILKTRMQQIDDNASDDSTDTCPEEPLHTQPLPFLAFVITQIVSGIVVGAVTNAIAQIVALVVFVLVFLLCAWRWMQWRNTRVTKALVFGLGLIKIVNLGLIFAFVSSSDDAAISDGPHAVGIAYIVLNSVVIVGFFVRHFGMANRLARIVWDERSRIRKATQPISDDSSDRPAYTSIASTPAHTGPREQSAV